MPGPDCAPTVAIQASPVSVHLPGGATKTPWMCQRTTPIFSSTRLGRSCWLVRGNTMDSLEITAEPYANGGDAVGRILFLANVGEVLELGHLLCVHAWHWPSDRTRQEMEPHVTFVEPGRNRIVASWHRQVGDVVEEGEVIGILERTENPENSETECEPSSWQDQMIERERRSARRLAIQLGVDLGVVELADPRTAVMRTWECMQDVTFESTRDR